MVMQAATDFLVGGLNPGVANMAVAPPLASTNQDSNRHPKILQFCSRVRYHSTGAGCDINVSPHCLEPSHRNTPPPPSPPPPLKKELSSFRG